MKELKIHATTADSTIFVGGSLQDLRKVIPTPKTVIITDSNVKHYYHRDFPPSDVIEIGTGEGIKTLQTVRDIYGKLLEEGADRTTFIVGVGGGIVCDIAGFVASTYLRGIRFGFVASTLLSQVDASVGGKNGVNFAGYKNMVGVFSQPEFVICDLNLLQTLPEKEILCGMAEIVKHAAIADADLFSYLESHWERALQLDLEVIEKLVYTSVLIKSAVVSCDEMEKGERRKLNFGHTFGHAIEKTTGMAHGEAISLGMLVAAGISAERGYLRTEDTERIRQLLSRLKLPTVIQGDAAEVIDALKKDKKRIGDQIHFVLLQGIGHAIVEEISIKELETAITDYL